MKHPVRHRTYAVENCISSEAEELLIDKIDSLESAVHPTRKGWHVMWLTCKATNTAGHVMHACNKSDVALVTKWARVALTAILTLTSWAIARKFSTRRETTFSFENVAVTGYDNPVTLNKAAASRLSTFRKRTSAMTAAEFVQHVMAKSEYVTPTTKRELAEQAVFAARRLGAVSPDECLAALRKLRSPHAH